MRTHAAHGAVVMMTPWCTNMGLIQRSRSCAPTSLLSVCRFSASEALASASQQQRHQTRQSQSIAYPTPAGGGGVSSTSTPAAMGKKKMKRLLRQQQQQQSSASAAAVVGGPEEDGRPSVSASPAEDASPVDRRVVPLSAYKNFGSVTSLRAFRKEFASLAPGERYTACVQQQQQEIPVGQEPLHVEPAAGASPSDVRRVGGRVVSIRDLGKLLFLTIRSAGETIQVCAHVGNGSDGGFTREALADLKAQITTGDIIGAQGIPGRTKKGELSLFADRIQVLAPYVCSDLTVVPDQRAHESKASPAVSDPELKYRYRFVDMITDPTTIQVFKARHAVTDCLRQFLNQRGFTEVETPMFHSVPCGANAKPFTTHHNCNNTDLFLRIAPELFLKQCVVGGMDCVYEIGKVFRNEDADRSHNPEFTSCEFYAAYHTHEDLMGMTEALIQALAVAVVGKPMMEVHVASRGAFDDPKAWVTIDLTKPYPRVSVYDAIQKAANVELPPPTELDTPRGIAFMAAIFLQHNIPLPSVRTAAKLFDKLIDYFVTDHVVEPTFVCDHPLFMSPLAKEHEARPGLSERFELFVNGMEVCNAYSELNDPQEQLRRFEQQIRDKDMGDDEAMSLDETFLKSLQTGMPPTAGWGMGIDRIVMLLTKSKSIRDVIIFPLLRPDDSSNDVKRRRKTASFFGFNQHMTLFCLSALEAELQRRGQHGLKTEHLKALRRTVMELNRRSTELHDQWEHCREGVAGAGADGKAPCSFFQRLLFQCLFGPGRR